MANPAESEVQNLLPVQAYFDAQNNFVTFIGQNKPFYATPDPNQSGLHITNSTIDSSVIGGITPSSAHFTTATVSTQPSSATDVVNLLTLQSYAAGISWKQPCQVATLTSITLSGLQLIDGYTTVANDRVLVKNQGTASENGIYIASSGTWSRATDADTWNELICAISFIEYGSQKGGAWFCTAQAGGTIDVTAVNWSQFTTSATYSAGTGLSLTGTVFSITDTGVTASSYGSASKTVTLAINAQGQATSASQQDIAIAGSQITSGTIGSSYLSGSYSGITGVGTLTNLTVTNPISGSITGNAGTASNLSGGAVGSLPYQTALNTTGFLAPSTNGYILSLVAGVPAWIPNTVGTVTAVTASAPLASSGGATPNITITQATTSTDGYLSSANWNTFNNKANSGVNSDITSMTGLTGGISTPTFIQWGNGTGQTAVAGKQYYDPATGSHNLIMGGGNITQQIGEELFVYGKASATITEGQLICQTGVVGASGQITFGPSPASLTNNDGIIGVATENIASGSFGRITFFGVVHGIDTSGTTSGQVWADNDTLWYNPAGGGLLTNVKPSAPNIKYSVAKVIHAGNGGSGSIQVYLEPGSTFGGTDSNVQLGTPTNGKIITYNGSAGYYADSTLTAGTGISISASATGVLTVSNTATTSIAITDDTTSATTFYPTFTSATSGSITSENVSSTKLKYVPSTGTLSATKYLGDGSALTGIVSGASISNDTTTASNLYPLFATVTTGVPTTIYTSNAKYLYKPSTGDLQSSQLVATNGLVLNAYALSASYTIPTGYSANSVGADNNGGFTIPTGMAVTVSTGSRWVIQ